MNDLMSFGLHRVWKDVLVAKVRPSLDAPFRSSRRRRRHRRRRLPRGEGGRPADRGDGRRRQRRHAARGGEARGEARFLKRLTFVEGNAEALPLPDARFDAYTIAFGIRNVPRIEDALSEAYRVLKRGGRFLCLEFSRVDLPVLDRFYDAYSFAAIPAIGKVVTGDGGAYRYLVESIRKFPPPERFAEMIGEAGFARVDFTRLSGGVVAIHSGWKL